MYQFNGCQQCYFQYWYDANVLKTMSQEEWDAWYNAHCAQCPAMNEICMADEM